MDRDVAVHHPDRDAARSYDLRVDVLRTRDAGGCHVLLAVGTVKPQPASCWIDQKVGNQVATLVWDCSSGEARADFAVPFTGTVKSGMVEITATTHFSWSDGCQWRSNQRIDGMLSSGSLTYHYSEEPIEGTGCAPAYCKATAPVLVQ